MSEPTHTCLRCQSSMELGFLLDNTQGGYARTVWVSGAPEHNIWTGLRLKGHVVIPVVAYRCTQCGLLEFFAPSPDAPENILLRPAQADSAPAETNQLLRASQEDEHSGET